jgi:hypothetical protein
VRTILEVLDSVPKIFEAPVGDCAAAPVIAVADGADHLYVVDPEVPVGTCPSVPSVGVILKVNPLQTVVIK